MGKMMSGLERNILQLGCCLTLILIGACSPQAADRSICPVSGPPAFVMRLLMMLPGGPNIVTSSSTAPSDTSTSTVITPNPADQIKCGKAELTTTSDVVFSTPKLADGTTKTLKMDILAPKAPGKHPLVVYVTGGGFIVAPKESALNLRTYVAEAGFVVASIEYRTTNDHANYRDGLADVKSAVRFLRAHANEYGIDPTRVAVWGESAGGYLVAMTGVTNGQKKFDIGDNLNQSSAVQAVIVKFGAADMSKVGADLDDKTRKFYADPNNPIMHYLDGQASTAANPITYIQPSDPAFLIFHGSQDRIISPSETLALHNALTAAGVSSKRYVLKGANHGDMIFMGDSTAGLPWSTNQVMNIMVDFLKHEIGEHRAQAK
jgi:acetyl esterase/lipase